MAKQPSSLSRYGRVKRGVNYLPEDRNYDLYKLACKVTARRFFPNFLNLDATFNQNEKWRADDPERYKWEIATMGCPYPRVRRPLGREDQHRPR